MLIKTAKSVFRAAGVTKLNLSILCWPPVVYLNRVFTFAAVSNNNVGNSYVRPTFAFLHAKLYQIGVSV